MGHRKTHAFAYLINVLLQTSLGVHRHWLGLPHTHLAHDYSFATFQRLVVCKVPALMHT